MVQQHKYGWWRNEADTQTWQKYFRAKERAEAGLIGNAERTYQCYEFNKYELTTKAGTDNDFKTMVKHHKILMIYLKRKGYELEYCSCPELSPGRGLLHIHGIFRADISIPVEKRFPNQSELSDYWKRIHEAPVVWIKYPKNHYESYQYMSKHVVKEYPVSSRLGYRMLISRGWLVKNNDIVRKILSTVAVINMRKGGETKKVWEYIEKQIYERWLTGKASLPFQYKNKSAYLEGQKIMMSDGFINLDELKKEERLLKNVRSNTNRN